MNGEAYASYDEFINACKNPSVPLDTGHNLAKMYTIGQIKDFANRFDINTNCPDEEGCGLRKRYNLSYHISMVVDTEIIGKELAAFDHNLFFPLVSYYALPESKPYDSIENFISLLNNKNIKIDRDSNLFHNNNGITNPKGRHCKLESVSFSDQREVVSFLYSCNRILLKPDHPQSDFKSCFLARIPVLAKILFKYRLVEFSTPRFSEAILFSGWSNKEPTRYQIAIRSTQQEFLELIGYNYNSINYDSLTLYLETQLDSEDLGWTIAPLVGAEFDLEQNVIPLKKIFNQFSESLKREIESLKIEHVLSEIDLYKVFRALKEQSHTSSLVLKAPLGIRGGGVKLSILYGSRDSEYSPLIILASNNESITNSLRSTVVDSQIAKIKNPHNLKSLLSS